MMDCCVFSGYLTRATEAIPLVCILPACISAVPSDDRDLIAASL